MSDYLGRLVARTVAPRGIVGPRVASAFEPPLEQERFVIAPRGEAVTAPTSTPGPASPVRSVAAPPPLSESDSAVATLQNAVPVIIERTHAHREGEHEHEPQHDPEERVQVHERVHERVRERVHVRSRIHDRERDRLDGRERITKEHTSSSSEAPPPIEITIGRIDVRAVVAAPSQKPQSKRPPIQSLEEYVAKRDGGGR